MKALSRQSISESSEEFLLQTYPMALRPLCRHPVLAASLYICFATLIYCTSTLIFGGFNSGAKVNFTDDWGYIAYLVFSFGTVYYYFRLPALFGRTLGRLRNNEVFTSDEVHIGERVSRFAQDSRLRRAPPYAIGTILFVVQIVAFPAKTHDPVFWYDVHPMNAICITVTWLPLWIVLSGLVISLAISGAAFNSIFATNRVVVHSLHPDKSGGFSPIGRFSFRMTMMALLPGIMLAVVIGRNVELKAISPIFPAFILLTIAYVAVVPTLFYLPIRGAHKAMKNFRDDLIGQAYARYSNYNMSIYDMKDNEQAWANIAGVLDQMDAVKRFAAHGSSYPVWPFDLRIRVGVLINSILPLCLTVIGIAIDPH